MMNPYRFLATSDHAIARAARNVRRQVRELTLPAPRPIVLPMRWAYEAARETYYYGARVLVCEPLFKSYCKEFGKNVRTGNFIHFIVGRGDILVGNDVLLDGKINILFAARFSDSPTLRIGDGTGIGHECKFAIGKSITIGKHCRIAAGAYLFDSNGHPSNPEERQQGLPPSESEVKPIVIEDNVWIGTRAIISPGVRIGEGSVVSAGAVVISDVPPYTVVAGNPARRVANLQVAQAPSEADGPQSQPASRRGGIQDARGQKPSLSGSAA